MGVPDRACGESAAAAVRMAGEKMPVGALREARQWEAEGDEKKGKGIGGFVLSRESRQSASLL
jgi:hypothetical protein